MSLNVVDDDDDDEGLGAKKFENHCCNVNWIVH